MVFQNVQMVKSHLSALNKRSTYFVPMCRLGYLLPTRRV